MLKNCLGKRIVRFSSFLCKNKTESKENAGRRQEEKEFTQEEEEVLKRHLLEARLNLENVRRRK